MFPETHEFLSWADSVPPYSQTAAEGIPNEAYVHTIQNEVRTYFTTCVYLACRVASSHYTKHGQNSDSLLFTFDSLLSLSHFVFTLDETWSKLLLIILLASHYVKLVAEYVHTLQDEVSAVLL